MVILKTIIRQLRNVPLDVLPVFLWPSVPRASPDLYLTQLQEHVLVLVLRGFTWEIHLQIVNLAPMTVSSAWKEEIAYLAVMLILDGSILLATDANRNKGILIKELEYALHVLRAVLYVRMEPFVQHVFQDFTSETIVFAIQLVKKDTIQTK